MLGFCNFLMKVDPYWFIYFYFENSSLNILQKNYRYNTISNFPASSAILIQNNVNTANTFNRPWLDFRTGFGDSTGTYWLGNDAIHNLTTPNACQLYIRFLTLINNGVQIAIYDNFSVGDSAVNYILSATKSGGNATVDGMTELSSGSFSTYDDDNDRDPRNNCANHFNAGWWFGRDTEPGNFVCGTTMLNGGSSWFVWGNSTSTVLLQSSQMWIVCWPQLKDHNNSHSRI